MRVTVAHAISNLLSAIEHAPAQNTEVWTARNRERLSRIIKEHLPSGSGFDNGTTLAENSTPERLVFHTAFHHMNESGMYDGWTAHSVTVKASLLFGLGIIVTGKDRDRIKDAIYQTFESALKSETEL